MEQIAILPMALTVMIGPQLLVAILLVTQANPVKRSLAYLLGVSLTTVLMTSLYYLFLDWVGMGTFKLNINGQLLRYLFVFVLLIQSVRTIMNRDKLRNPPKWMMGLANAGTARIFAVGVLLIAIMPADIAVLLAMASLLQNNGALIVDALPFFFTVFLIAATPLVIYLIAGQYGRRKIDSFNRYIQQHGYLMNLIIYGFFIFLMLK